MAHSIIYITDYEVSSKPETSLDFALLLAQNFRLENNNNNNNNNRFNTETNDISTMNSNNRIAATLYSLGTQFVSGI